MTSITGQGMGIGMDGAGRDTPRLHDCLGIPRGMKWNGRRSCSTDKGW
jgi:hypothetical protein